MLTRVGEPRAARLAVAWLVIGLLLASMVGVPFALYVWGKQIRNRLAFEVAPFELVLERTGRAMAVRERTLRAYLYEPTPERFAHWQESRVVLDEALAEARRMATAHEPEMVDDVAELVELAAAWEETAADVVARAAMDRMGALGVSARPGPVYDSFQGALGTAQSEIEATKDQLVADMGVADDARAAMPLLLALLSIPVMVYTARLSSNVLTLLAVARGEQQRLAAILEHMVDPVLVTDREGKVTLLNPAARSVLAMHPGDRIGSLGPRLRRALRAESIEPAAMLDAIARADAIAETEAVVEVDGDAIPVSISSAPIRVDRDPIGAVTVLRDLTDRVRYEEKRLEADRFQSLGAMAERIAHDFGNYLEAASAATVMLEKPSAADPAKRSRWIGIIRATFEEGRSVLAGLRTLSFVGHEPRLTPVVLESVVDRAVDVARLARRDAQRIEIERELAGRTPVRASEQDLARAIVNIVVNAIDAMPYGGRIDVRCEADDHRARIVVRDQGVGIAPEDMQRIFDMYYTTKGERGSGMGLSLAREVLRVHGGDIRVESAPGAGTTFVLELPRVQDHEIPARDPAGPDDQDTRMEATS